MFPVLLEQTYSTGPSLSDTFDYGKQFFADGESMTEAEKPTRELLEFFNHGKNI